MRPAGDRDQDIPETAMSARICSPSCVPPPIA